MGLNEKNSSISWEVLVGGTGFEPVTSAMSTQRSKPTELTALIKKTSASTEVSWVGPEGFEPPTLSV